VRSNTRVAPLVILLLGTAPGALAAQAGSLKDIQRSIRERMLTEAGTADLVYTKVDFSHCAATIQSRTIRQSTREVRLTSTFHLTTLTGATSAASGDPGFVVQLGSTGQGPAFRQLEQVIDSGTVREAVRTLVTLEISFPRRSSAELVREGFARMATLCKDDDPLLRGAQDE
jgi:hypothetical protein